MLANFQTEVAKRAAEAAAAKEAEKKKLPDDDAMDEDGLPHALNTAKLVWINSQPRKQPGQSEEDFAKARNEWFEADPEKNGPSQPEAAQPAGGERGRTRGTREEAPARSRSRGDQPSS